MSASRSYSPPLDPILRRLPLEVGRTFPARKIRSAWVRFLPGHWALGLWKIGVGAVPLLRLPFPNQRPEAVFRRRGAQCAPAGRSGTGPYAETDAFPDTPQGQVSSPARRRQRSSCRGGYQPPEAARWGHRALQKSKHVFRYAAGTAPCACPSQKICHVGRGCVPAAPWGCAGPENWLRIFEYRPAPLAERRRIGYTGTVSSHFLERREPALVDSRTREESRAYRRSGRRDRPSNRPYGRCC